MSMENLQDSQVFSGRQYRARITGNLTLTHRSMEEGKDGEAKTLYFIAGLNIETRW